MEHTMRAFLLLLFILTSLPGLATETTKNPDSKSYAEDSTNSDEKEWEAASCKWRVLDKPFYMGMSESDNLNLCFLSTRIMFIQLITSGSMPQSAIDAYTKEMTIVFKHENGVETHCRIITNKLPKDPSITNELLMQPLMDENGCRNTEFYKIESKVSEYMQLQCLTV